MIRVYAHAGGATRPAERVERAWLEPGSPVLVWVDLFNPTPDEGRLLSDVFHFHELAVEDALSTSNDPKVESYGDYLYLILHAIDFKAPEHCFKTHDIDFFLGKTYLVTVHTDESRSIEHMADICGRNAMALGEGPAALMHRIIDMVVDNYRPEIDKLNERLDALEKEVFEKSNPRLARDILDFKRDVASLRRIVQPQRDVVGRLARREFPFIDETVAYRFRDVHDHLVRLVDEAMFFQDRITSLLDAHLSIVSNQLNSVMKILTVIATVFMPLTFITGLYGMNVDLPHFGLGGTRMFWLLMGLMMGISGVMLWYFRRQGWI
ncbi:MAG: magnesium and cobalt transport protein CorA [Acidobacteria bacterium]|nr:MAG: magnesium and cobalt transport protein CorA [Acidobacteriota bacterium]